MDGYHNKKILARNYFLFEKEISPIYIYTENQINFILFNYNTMIYVFVHIFLRQMIHPLVKY